MALTTKIRGNTQIVGLSITNAEIATNAAIAYSKLNLSNSILNADINSSAAIAESKLAFSTTTGHDHDGTNSKSLPASAFLARMVYNEVPSGTINGTNTVFVLANTPGDNLGVDCSVDVYLNGVHLRPGTSSSDQDYFINGNATITTTFTPTSGDVILVSYLK